MKLPSLATFALLLVIATGRAQQLQDLDLLVETSPDYVLTRWGMEDGLPSDRVRAALQSRDSFVWAATFNGLARFDGVNFRVSNDEHTPVLKNRLINRLYEDRQVRLWIGSDTGDLLWRDPAGFHAVAVKNTWRISPIVRMVDSANGVVLALNRDGQLLRVTNGMAAAPTGESLYSDLLVDRQNQVWAVRRGGAMRRLTAEGEAPESVGPPQESGCRNAAAARRRGGFLHDDQGTSLTEIHTASALGLDPGVPPQEANEYFHEISQRARELVMSLDEIVWAVNPKNDNFGSLATYFCLFIEQFLRSAKVSYRFDVTDDLPTVPLDSDRRHSLFLALKEPLNNAVRHAWATHVTRAISIASGERRVAVTDAGCGFDPGMKRGDADGLENMRARLEVLGGRCEIVSRTGAGTKVNFALPMAG